jgi:hypothetical protein
VQTPSTRSPIQVETNIFDVESDLDEGHLLESLMWGGRIYKIPSPSPTMGGMVHLAK